METKTLKDKGERGHCKKNEADQMTHKKLYG